MAIQGVALQHEHGAHLAVDGGEDDAARPDGEEAHDALQLLDLGDRAQPPWVHRAVDLVLSSLHCSLVQEPGGSHKACLISRDGEHLRSESYHIKGVPVDLLQLVRVIHFAATSYGRVFPCDFIQQ